MHRPVQNETMKKRNLDIKILVDGLEALAWVIGVRHVPEWDNVPDPDDYYTVPKDLQQESTTSPTEAEAIDQAFSPQFYKYGKDEIKEGRLVQAHKIGIVTREAGEMDWDVQIYQETDDSPWAEFHNWHETDDKAIATLSKTDQENYRKVRPDVLTGRSNKEIAAKHNRSLRWAETHAGRVRAAFDKRTNISPTG